MSRSFAASARRVRLVDRRVSDWATPPCAPHCEPHPMCPHRNISDHAFSLTTSVLSRPSRRDALSSDAPSRSKWAIDPGFLPKVAKTTKVAKAAKAAKVAKAAKAAKAAPKAGSPPQPTPREGGALHRRLRRRPSMRVGGCAHLLLICFLVRLGLHRKCAQRHRVNPRGL